MTNSKEKTIDNLEQYRVKVKIYKDKMMCAHNPNKECTCPRGK